MYLMGLPEEKNFLSGSPRYYNGPLLSTVEQRLSQIKAGDPTAIAQTRKDAMSGGAGWREVALILAPAVRPDLFGSPSRPLNATDETIVAAVGGPYVAPSAPRIVPVTPPTPPPVSGGSGQPIAQPPVPQQPVVISSTPVPQIPLPSNPGSMVQNAPPGLAVPAGTPPASDQAGTSVVAIPTTGPDTASVTSGLSSLLQGPVGLGLLLVAGLLSMKKAKGSRRY